MGGSLVLGLGLAVVGAGRHGSGRVGPGAGRAGSGRVGHGSGWVGLGRKWVGVFYFGKQAQLETHGFGSSSCLVLSPSISQQMCKVCFVPVDFWLAATRNFYFTARASLQRWFPRLSNELSIFFKGKGNFNYI